MIRPSSARIRAEGRNMSLRLAVATVSALVGFLAGLLTFRIKQRWCPTCGETLTCPYPSYHVKPVQTWRFRHDPKPNAAPAGARREYTNRRTNTVHR